MEGAQRRRRAASRAAGHTRMAWLTLFWAVWEEAVAGEADCTRSFAVGNPRG